MASALSALAWPKSVALLVPYSSTVELGKGAVLAFEVASVKGALRRLLDRGVHLLLLLRLRVRRAEEALKRPQHQYDKKRRKEKPLM